MSIAARRAAILAVRPARRSFDRPTNFNKPISLYERIRNDISSDPQRLVLSKHAIQHRADQRGIYEETARIIVEKGYLYKSQSSNKHEEEIQLLIHYSVGGRVACVVIAVHPNRSTYEVPTVYWVDCRR